MKTFIALCLVLNVVLAAQVFTPPVTDEQLDVLKRTYQACVLISDADKKLIANAGKGDIAADPKLTEFCNCVARQYCLVDEQGKPKPSFIKNKMTYIGADGVFDACGYLSTVLPEIFAVEA